MSEVENALTHTGCHARESEERFVRQAALIGHLAARGFDTAEAGTILERMRTTLELTREHLSRLRATRMEPRASRSRPTMTEDQDGALHGE